MLANLENLQIDLNAKTRLQQEKEEALQRISTKFTELQDEHAELQDEHAKGNYKMLYFNYGSRT